MIFEPMMIFEGKKEKLGMLLHPVNFLAGRAKWTKWVVWGSLKICG